MYVITIKLAFKSNQSLKIVEKNNPFLFKNRMIDIYMKLFHRIHVIRRWFYPRPIRISSLIININVN